MANVATAAAARGVLTLRPVTELIGLPGPIIWTSTAGREFGREVQAYYRQDDGLLSTPSMVDMPSAGWYNPPARPAMEAGPPLLCAQRLSGLVFP